MMTLQAVFKTSLIATAVSYAMTATAAEWVNKDNVLDPGTTIQAIAANANKNSYTSNPALKNNAWGMQGAWLSFQVTSVTTTTITLSSATTNAPGFTVYRTNGAFLGEGKNPDKTDPDAFAKGAVHSFNQVAQAGTAGIVWATDATVKPSLAGNTTTNGIIETLGYANGSATSFVNGYGANVKSGAYDLSVDDLYESGVFGTTGTVGAFNFATLTLNNLAPGYYTIFLGGTNSSDSGTPIDVKVSAAPVSIADCVFNAQEKANPQLFAPAGAVSQTLATYYARYYKDTKSYLGISSGSGKAENAATDNHLYQVGADGKLVDRGEVSALASSAGCQ